MNWKMPLLLKYMVGFPVVIEGYYTDMDRKLEKNRAAMSMHAMVQEYLNLSEEYLYALVTNGRFLRLLHVTRLYESRVC